MKLSTKQNKGMKIMQVKFVDKQYIDNSRNGNSRYLYCFEYLDGSGAFMAYSVVDSGIGLLGNLRFGDVLSVECGMVRGKWCVVKAWQ
jgi:hypothetical protein